MKPVVIIAALIFVVAAAVVAFVVLRKKQPSYDEEEVISEEEQQQQQEQEQKEPVKQSPVCMKDITDDVYEFDTTKYILGADIVAGKAPEGFDVFLPVDHPHAPAQGKGKEGFAFSRNVVKDINSLDLSRKYYVGRRVKSKTAKLGRNTAVTTCAPEFADTVYRDTDVCFGYSMNETIPDACYSKIWNTQGCLTSQSAHNDWSRNQTRQTLTNDSKAWAIMSDDWHRAGCYTNDRSKWPDTSIKNMYASIQNKGNNLCADVASASNNDYAQVVAYGCNNGLNQQFKYIPETGQFKALHSGKCLDVIGNRTDNYAPVSQYSCNNGDNQKFDIRADGVIQGRQSGKCLTFGGDSMSQLMIIDCEDSTGLLTTSNNARMKFGFNTSTIQSPSMTATDCQGDDCTIENQMCYPGTPGSSGKTWKCINQKWVEQISMTATSCEGSDCTVENQMCYPGSPGSSGKTWKCINKKWVEQEVPEVPKVIDVEPGYDISGKWQFLNNGGVFNIQPRVGNISQTDHPAGNITYLDKLLGPVWYLIRKNWYGPYGGAWGPATSMTLSQAKQTAATLGYNVICYNPTPSSNPASTFFMAKTTEQDMSSGATSEGWNMYVQSKFYLIQLGGAIGLVEVGTSNSLTRIYWATDMGNNIFKPYGDIFQFLEPLTSCGPGQKVTTKDCYTKVWKDAGCINNVSDGQANWGATVGMTYEQLKEDARANPTCVKTASIVPDEYQCKCWYRTNTPEYNNACYQFGYYSNPNDPMCEFG